MAVSRDQDHIVIERLKKLYNKSQKYWKSQQLRKKASSLDDVNLDEVKLDEVKLDDVNPDDVNPDEVKLDDVNPDEINKEIRWILKNRKETGQFNGQSINNLWTILHNYNYGYKTKKINPITIVNLMHSIPDDIWTDLLDATLEQIYRMNENQLNNIFKMFNRMNIWKNVDKEFSNFRRELIYKIDYLFGKQNLEKNNTKKQNLDVNITTRTLMNLNADWDDLPKSTKKHIVNEIVKFNNKDNLQLLNLLWSCAGLGMPNKIFYPAEETMIAEKLKKLIEDQLNILEKTPFKGTKKSPWKETSSTLRQLQQVRLYF